MPGDLRAANAALGQSAADTTHDATHTLTDQLAESAGNQSVADAANHNSYPVAANAALYNIDQWAANAAPHGSGLLAANAANDSETANEEVLYSTYKIIESSKEERDLGILVDMELKFSNHIEKQVNIANRLLGMIRRTYVYLDSEVMKLLFCSLVRPHLEFANCVWSPRFIKDKNLIEAVQRRATKLIPGLKDLTYEERLRRMDLPSLDYRRRRGDMIEVYKYLHDIYQIPEDLLPLERSGVNTRGHSLKLAKRNCRLDLRKNFFSYRVVAPWNALPEETVTAPSLNAFKARLDKLWINSKYITL
jgi:hypothetical protein